MFEIVGWKLLSFEYELDAVIGLIWRLWHVMVVAKLFLNCTRMKVGKLYDRGRNIQLPLLYIGSKENSFCGLLGEARWRVARSPRNQKRWSGSS